MLMRLPIRPAFLAAFALLCHPAAAQEGTTLHFLSFPNTIDPKPVELLLPEGKTIQVQIPSNEVSLPYRVTRLSEWAVGETVIKQDGKSSFNVFGKAKALTSSKQLILLICKGKNHSDGMEVIPIDYNVGKFGGGKFLFMNAAKVDIAGDAGGEKFVVQPGKHMIVKPKPGANGRTFQAMFYFRKDNEARPFFSSKWPLSDKARAMIFFYHDPETNHLRFHAVRDFT